MSTLKYYDTNSSSWVPLVVGSQGPPGSVNGATAPLYYDSGTGKVSIAQNELAISVNQVGGAVSLSAANTLSGNNIFNGTSTFNSTANFVSVVATTMSVTTTATASTDVANKAYVDSAISVSTGISSVTNVDGSILVDNTDPKNPVVSVSAVSVAKGGTGATTAALALTNLGAAPTASPTFTGTATFTGVTLVGLTIDGGTA